jgi:hypothetical protein
MLNNNARLNSLIIPPHAPTEIGEYKLLPADVQHGEERN